MDLMKMDLTEKDLIETDLTEKDLMNMVIIATKNQLVKKKLNKQLQKILLFIKMLLYV